MAKNWHFNRGLFGGGNCVLRADGFYISFRGDTAGVMPGIIGEFMAGDDDGDGETALCKDGEFYILNGDFRSEYEALVDEGFDACFAFYKSKEAEHRSQWSHSGAVAS